MLVSPEIFAYSLKNKSYAELINIKTDLTQSVEEYVPNPMDERIDPSPDAINQMNREYLSAVRYELKLRIIADVKKAVIEFWKTDIKMEYCNEYLLKEDTLKNSFYYHLRERFDKIFQENDIRIFTEFRFRDTNQKADIAIVQIIPWDPKESDKSLEESVIDVLAVFELKYKNFSKEIERAIYTDRSKIKGYCKRYEKLYPDCQYFYVVLYEEVVEPFFWMDKRSKSWAIGKVTELAAGYLDGEETIQFKEQMF